VKKKRRRKQRLKSRHKKKGRQCTQVPRVDVELRSLGEVEPSFLRAVFGESLEPITPALVERLTAEPGFPDRKQLLSAQSIGLRWCRERNTFFSEPEFIGGLFEEG